MLIRTLNIMLFFLFAVIAMVFSIDALGRETTADNPHYHRFRFEDTSLPVKERIRHGDRLIALQPEDSADIIMECAELSLKGGRFQEAEGYVTRLLEGHMGKTDVASRCGAMVLAAEIFMKNGNYRRATEMAEKVLATTKPDSLLYDDIKVYEVLSYINLLNPKINGTYLEYAESTYAKAERNGVNDSTLKKMKLFLLSMRIREALYKDSLRLVMRYAQEFDRLDTPRNILTTNLRGIVNVRLGDSLEARRYFLEGLEISPVSFNHSTVLLNLMSLLNNMHRYQESLDVYERYMDEIFAHPNIPYANLMDVKSAALAGTGRYREAYESLRESKDLSDSLLSATTINKSIHDLQIEKKDLDSARIEKSEKRYKVAMWIAVAVSMTIMALLWLRVIRMRKENENLCQSLSQSRSEASDNASGISMKEDEIKNMAKQLVSDTMVREHYARILEEVGQALRRHGGTPSEKITEIKSIMKDLDLSDQTLELFNNHFTKVDQRFVNEINRLHPDLTPNEMRLISYIVMNLTTKEIAEMTNKSVRSVESARYRLGKKLNLKEGDSLYSYLHSLANGSDD